jgi:replication factor C subunit 2/4
MTTDAQAALRRIIEQYSGTTRFCIICNYISKIIDPLASRCVKFRFSPIERVAQIERLQMISEREGLRVESPQVYERLVEISQGDLRRSINMLQTASAFKEKSLSVAVIDSISGVIPPATMTKID